MKRETKRSTLAILMLMSGLGLAALFILLFAELAEKMLEDELGLFDVFFIYLLKLFESGPMDLIMFIFTEMGSVRFITTLSIIVLCILLFRMRDKWGALFFLIAVGGGALLTILLKHLFSRERPSINEAIDAVGYSFPSGHSMGSLIFYGFLVYLIIRSSNREWLRWVSFAGLSLLVLLIGTSRIYLSAHYPSDVAAGYIAGMIWLVLSLMALEWIQWNQKSRVPAVNALRKILTPLYRAVVKKI